MLSGMLQTDQEKVLNEVRTKTLKAREVERNVHRIEDKRENRCR
jgi:hypothetical protein